MEIIWYEQAKEDLDGIYDFYYIKNIHVAQKIYNSIIDETELLRTHPHIAAVEESLDNEEFIFRSLVTKNKLFKIVYFVDGVVVVIVRVWCCRANPVNLTVKL